MLPRGFHQFEVIGFFCLERTLFVNTQVVLVRRITNMGSTIYGKSVQRGSSNSLQRVGMLSLTASLLTAFLGLPTAHAQTSVTTQHYDIARTGANTNETILTPSNVNISSFGKLFSYPVDGYVYAQPLYVAGVTLGAGTLQAGTTHNVAFVVTEHDTVYAFDADNNSGPNANPLWSVSLIGAGENTVPSNDLSCADIVPEVGISSTPVIDLSTNTIYVVAKTTVNDTTFIQRLHALDLKTGQEKLGGPVTLSASVSGNGSGSSAGVLNWDPKWQLSRASLLLLNGIVYIGTGSHCDNGPWHGWLLAYNASTLRQTGVWCSSANSLGSGIWGGGLGLAADVPAGKPYGRLFLATGNGTYDAVAPNYTNAMDYGDSILKLDLNNGVPTMNSNGTVVGDAFTPHGQANLNNIDGDQGSGAPILLPNSMLAQVGKSGILYILNRENLGGYNPNNTKDPGEAATIGGVWGGPAYWNGHLYVWGQADHLKAFSFTNGVLSANPTSTSNETAGPAFATYSPTPAISANGSANGIVWSLVTDNAKTQGRAILYAHDASNVAHLLYSSGVTGSESNFTRDNPGLSVKFVVPTVINGKVYAGMESQLSVFGLLNGNTQAATPAISPASQSFNSSFQVTITDSTQGASIYYTTDGSTPTTASTQYTAPFTVSTTTTVNAIAAGTGLLQSPVATATYTLTTQTAKPSFSPPPGFYETAQSVTISTTTPNATIYYTTDGSTPTTASTKYLGPVAVSTSETLSALATASGLSNSPVASGVYTIDTGVSSINFSSGFAGGGMDLNGSAKLNGSALELTDGGGGEAASAWYQVLANIQTFSTDFTFQTTPGTNPTADGFTFAIQGGHPVAIGLSGVGLGYQGIPSSVAVKFDLYSNSGEGPDSTGLYLNGAVPTLPAQDMSSSGVDLHSGHPFHAHLDYDGTILTLTLTDTVTNATFTTSWTVDIPTTVGGNLANVGFTGGTGGSTAVQSIQTWTFSSGVSQAAATPQFSPAGGTYTTAQTVTISDATSGATIYYTTNGTTPTTNSTQYTAPITVSSSQTLRAIAVANGFTQSAVGSASYTIGGGSTVINLGGGFTVGSMALNGSAKLSGTRLRLTDGGTGEAASAWYNSIVDVHQFTTNFSFQISGGTSPQADGFAFVMQSGSTTAIGSSGGSLGYGSQNGTGLPNSIAIKFDIYSNNGEGADSTGLYVNGAAPTTPALDMTSSGVNLRSGDVFNVQMSYDGTNLTMSITDATTNATFTHTWAINITGTVGGSNAYVGFTGGTGGYTAIQDIIGWTLTSSVSGTAAATPTFSPVAGTYATAQTVTISDTTSGATIYYTTNGTTPTTSSTKYTAPITVSSSQTIQAIAVASGFTQSAVGSATYTITPVAATPTFSPIAGTYTTTQTVTISDATSGATIYYTTNGTTPTTASTKYTAPITVSSTQTLKAIATATGFTQSAVGTAAYTISSGSNVISLGNGFTAGAMVLNGKSTLNGTRLRLTDGTTGDAASAWYNSPVNIQQFTTNFSFQITGGTNPTADGFTFAIQGVSSTAIGPSGAGLGYGGSGGIANSVAVKFDLYSNNGEGFDSTGLYVNGTLPTTPAVDMTSSGVNLHSTDIFNVQMSYDGTNLTMIITDATSNATFTKTWPINIPATVGGNTAFVGFTGGTGGNTAIQEIINLTMTSTPVPAAATPTFSPAAGTYTSAQTVTISDTTSGASIYYTTNGTTPTTSSTKYTAPITVSSTQIVQAIAVATGFSQSPVASSSYTITTGTTTINFGGGFTAGAMVLNGKSTLNGTRLRLTDGGTGEAASAWYSSQVNIQHFTSNFSFQISGGTNPPADGFAFVIQGGPSTAIGPSGQGLGYGGTGGIASSIAVKFDLYSNNGEGADSTGLYVNGAVPTTPAVDMTSSGLDLHTGDVFNVQMTYDGTNLTMTITDAATNATFTRAWPINIPATVGGNTAYAGFTGGTGGYTAIQEIINWTM